MLCVKEARCLLSYQPSHLQGLYVRTFLGRCSTDGTDRSFSLLFLAHKCTGLLKLSRLQRLVGAFSESAKIRTLGKRAYKLI